MGAARHPCYSAEEATGLSRGYRAAYNVTHFYTLLLRVAIFILKNFQPLQFSLWLSIACSSEDVVHCFDDSAVSILNVCNVFLVVINELQKKFIVGFQCFLCLYLERTLYKSKFFL